MSRARQRAPTTLRDLLKRHNPGAVLGGFRSRGRLIKGIPLAESALCHERVDGPGTRIIAVVNQKGGCGKTTTTINLAAFLARNGRRTLVVDMDPQGHATLGLFRAADSLTRTMYDVFLKGLDGRRKHLHHITRTIELNLDLAPADIRLSAVPEMLRAVPDRDQLLARCVGDMKGRYDYVIIDCPPNVGLLTFNALRVAREVIIPLDPSFFSLHGLGKLLETLDVLTKKAGHAVTFRALVTMYSGRTRFAKDVVAEIRRHLYGRHFNTVIRRSLKLAEAASHGVPISRYCSACAGFKDYESLTAEVLTMEGALSSGDAR